MRRTLLAALLLGVAGMTLAFPAAHHTVASPADVRLVVLFASGWNSQLSAGERGSVVSGAEAWNPARNALQSALPEGLANCADVDRQDFSSCTTSFSYTYGANRLNSGFPTSYTACDTLKSIKDSAQAMDAQVVDLEARFPNAQVVIAAHSLGGVVASYWADTTTTPLARVGGLVTFDSPVGGLSWASVRDVLEVFQLVTGHGGGAPGAAGTELLSKFVGSYQCPGTPAVFEDQLDPLRDRSVLADVANAQAKVVRAGGELRNLGSWGDPFIFGWNAAPVGKLIEGFLPLESCFATLQHPVTAWIWHASLPVTLPDPASCLKQVHGAILAHPPALAVLSSVAKKAFDRGGKGAGTATSPVSTRIPTLTSSPTSTSTTSPTPTQTVPASPVTHDSVEDALRAGAGVPHDFVLQLDERRPSASCNRECATATWLDFNGPTRLYSVTYSDSSTFKTVLVAIEQDGGGWKAIWNEAAGGSPPDGLRRPGKMVGGGGVDKTTPVKFCAESAYLLPDGVVIRLAFYNQSGTVVRWTSDVGDSRIYVVDDTGARYPSSKVGGRFAVEYPTGMPVGVVWTGWHEFAVPQSFQSLTLYYPGRSPIVLNRLSGAFDLPGGCEDW